MIEFLARAEIPPLHYASLRFGRNDNIEDFLNSEWWVGVGFELSPWVLLEQQLKRVGVRRELACREMAGNYRARVCGRSWWAEKEDGA